MKRCIKILLLFVASLAVGCGGAQPVGSKSRGPVADEAAPAQAPDAENAAERKPAGNAAAEKLVPRKIIYTGIVDLVVDDFDSAEGRMRHLVEEHEGYLANSDIHNQPGSPRSGTWTVRVPTKRFDAFLTAIVKFGEVRNRNTNSQDVTDAYYDSAARMKADEAEEKSLLALLEKTQGKVEDILRVREQLRTVRGQIEQRKSQLQRWDKDVDMATITVKLLDRRDYTPPLMPDFGSTVGRTFEGSVNALVLFGKAIVLTVVALAPWAAVLGLVCTPGHVMWRRRRAAANARIPTAVPADEQPGEPTP
jgi:hypothetical protein